jgi:uncharacterized repeat protein (TIGR03803 family)
MAQSSRSQGFVLRRAMFVVAMVIALAGGMAAAGQARKPASAGTYTLLYSFQCEPDGAGPAAGVIRDSEGNLYGTTYDGGTYGFGTVFKLAPDGTETLLHSFAGGSDGQYPQSDLTSDSAGNLYGTTSQGGLGMGVVFELTAAGQETVIYSLRGGDDGAAPVGGLLRDAAGNLYGTTQNGGPFGQGVVFKIGPGGKETVLYAFGSSGPSDGANPTGDLLRDGSGNTYGTTSHGGAFGMGAVFELAPGGTETVLHSFAGSPDDGEVPESTKLVRDAAGDLFGNTAGGGTQKQGTVFEVTASGAEDLLLSFNGRGQGGNPYGDLAGGGSGNIFGTTGSGGSKGGGACPSEPTGCGVLFEVSPLGKETVLHTFRQTSTDGIAPNGVIRDTAGNLYGTTARGGAYGGAYGCGTVFKYTP